MTQSSLHANMQHISDKMRPTSALSRKWTGSVKQHRTKEGWGAPLGADVVCNQWLLVGVCTYGWGMYVVFAYKQESVG
jgi:hypothetical protein